MDFSLYRMQMGHTESKLFLFWGNVLKSVVPRNGRREMMIGGRDHPRVKVAIRCKRCGERFVLKGKKEFGRYHTGFKQCLCDNEEDFEFEVYNHV